MKTYQDMLNEYIGGGDKNMERNGLCFSIWLLFKGKAYQDRRSKVLQRQCAIRTSIRIGAAIKDSQRRFAKD